MTTMIPIVEAAQQCSKNMGRCNSTKECNAKRKASRQKGWSLLLSAYGAHAITLVVVKFHHGRHVLDRRRPRKPTPPPPTGDATPKDQNKN
ncbi:unnamed protein product [Camellia sinensis]